MNPEYIWEFTRMSPRIWMRFVNVDHGNVFYWFRNCPIYFRYVNGYRHFAVDLDWARKK